MNRVRYSEAVAERLVLAYGASEYDAANAAETGNYVLDEEDGDPYDSVADAEEWMAATAEEGGPELDPMPAPERVQEAAIMGGRLYVDGVAIDGIVTALQSNGPKNRLSVVEYSPGRPVY